MTKLAEPRAPHDRPWFELGEQHRRERWKIITGFTGLLAISDPWLCQARCLLMPASAIDLDRLLKLRVAIGRIGEGIARSRY